MAIILVVLIAALCACAILARRSKRAISSDVWLLLVSLIPPIMGNFLIIVSGSWLVSNIGYYMYFTGLDWVVSSLLLFSCNYCRVNYQSSIVRYYVIALIAVDVFQILLNPITGHVFTTHPTLVDGAPYFTLVPLAGQIFHRIVAYGIFFASLGLFIYKTVKASLLYTERYSVILACMVVTGIWETYYIFSGSPIDSSMIGFGVFGLLVYYFAIIYKPVRLLDSMLSRIVSSMGNAVLFFDESGKCIYGNERARAMMGLPEEGDMPDDAEQIARSSFDLGDRPIDGEWSAMSHSGTGYEERYLDASVRMVRDDRGKIVGSSLVVRDATADQQRLMRERYLATHDRLTGIFNSDYFFESARALLDSDRSKTYLAVAIDIKNFKLVNDIFDRDFGDNVLKDVAATIAEVAPPHCVYGRLSADKFGMFLPEDEFDVDEVERVFGRISIGKSGVEYSLKQHIGIYRTEDPDMGLSVMFSRSYMAIKSIKEDYQKSIAFYDETMRADAIWRDKLADDLGTALAEGQIEPYLHPLVNAENAVVGAEVLTRWLHPTEGVLMPTSYVPVFEESGLIAKLDMFMWECACKILANWKKRGVDLFLSVNISAKDFYFTDVYGAISGLVKRYGVDPSTLRLEITETVMIDDIQNRVGVIERLRDEGFLIEMDDFGSGYSSLNMLKDIHFDILKIDMAFLYETADTERAQTILQSIINLAENLGMPAITEGVETAEQRDMLLAMGCRLFQGYYFALPMSEKEFEVRYLT